MALNTPIPENVITPESVIETICRAFVPSHEDKAHINRRDALLSHYMYSGGEFIDENIPKNNRDVGASVSDVKIDVPYNKNNHLVRNLTRRRPNEHIDYLKYRLLSFSHVSFAEASRIVMFLQRLFSFDGDSDIILSEGVKDIDLGVDVRELKKMVLSNGLFESEGVFVPSYSDKGELLDILFFNSEDYQLTDLFLICRYGNDYHVYLENVIWKMRREGDKYIPLGVYNHDKNIIPYAKFGGIQSSSVRKSLKDRGTTDSVLLPTLPALDAYAGQYSDLSTQEISIMYIRQWTSAAEECKDCSGKGKISGSTCKKCNGQGKIPFLGMDGVIRTVLDNENRPVIPQGFIQPDTSVFQVLLESLEKKRRAIYSSVGLDILVEREKAGDTAEGRRIENESSYNILLQIDILLSACIEGILNYLYKIAIRSENEGGDRVKYVTVARKNAYEIKPTESILAEISNINVDITPSYVLKGLYKEYIYRTYPNPSDARREWLKIYLDPFFGRSSDIVSLYTGVELEIMKYIYTNINKYISMLNELSAKGIVSDDDIYLFVYEDAKKAVEANLSTALNNESLR